MYKDSPIKKCRLIDLPRHESDRGMLTEVQNNGSLPFSVKRVFYVYDVPADAERGAHAHRHDMELIMADLDMVQRRVDKAQKAAKGDKKFLHEVEVFKALAEHLDGGKSARTFDCSDDDKALIATSDLLTLKPIIYAANMDEDGFANQDGNQYLQQVKELADREGAQVLPICAKLEQDIAELDGEDRAMFLEELGIQESGLDRLIKCSYALLGLISFLTYGEDECRAWTIKNGTKAPQAAGKIHSDIERGFIRAETINFDDMIRCGSVAAAKEKGLLRSEGKEYVVKDGDMIYFRFNV